MNMVALLSLKTDPRTGRLDELFHERVCKPKKLCKAWTIVKLLLTLLQGQAFVERDFSIYRQIEEEYVHSIGGICNMVDKKMTQSVAGAKQKYMTSS